MEPIVEKREWQEKDDVSDCLTGNRQKHIVQNIWNKMECVWRKGGGE